METTLSKTSIDYLVCSNYNELCRYANSVLFHNGFYNVISPNEIVHQTYEEMLAKGCTINDTEHFVPKFNIWVRNNVVNKLRDYAKTYKGTPESNDFIISDMIPLKHFNEDDFISELFDNKAKIKNININSYIERIQSNAQKRALILKTYGLTPQEISVKLKVTSGCLRSLISDARRNLFRMLKDDGVLECEYEDMNATSNRVSWMSKFDRIYLTDDVSKYMYNSFPVWSVLKDKIISIFDIQNPIKTDDLKVLLHINTMNTGTYHRGNVRHYINELIDEGILVRQSDECLYKPSSDIVSTYEIFNHKNK